MNVFGKSLFWIGFIIVMGVVAAYLVMMLIGSIAYLTASAILTICAVIVVGAFLMLIGRSYERRSEHKRLEEARQAEQNK